LVSRLELFFTIGGDELHDVFYYSRPKVAARPTVRAATMLFKEQAVAVIIEDSRIFAKRARPLLLAIHSASSLLFPFPLKG
jgi:hypothetical protein